MKPARKAEVRDLSDIDMPRVAAAVRWLFVAVVGTNCTKYAQYGAELLQRLGVAAEVVVGYSAWRVGDDPRDIVAYHPNHSPLVHVWIEAAGKVIDFTTFDLMRKRSKQLRMRPILKSGRTVTWCPDFLVAEKHEIVDSIKHVVRGARPPLFYYERIPSIEEEFRVEGDPPKPEAMSMLWTIYHNPEVFGPSNIMEHA